MSKIIYDVKKCDFDVNIENGDHISMSKINYDVKRYDFDVKTEIIYHI